jgi:predicted  nucleic acid-binding Zn-ribbon protein
LAVNLIAPWAKGGIKMGRIPGQVKLLLKLHKLESNDQSIDNAKELQKVVKNLNPSLMKLYLRLKKRKGKGVAVLESGVCSACRMVYPESHELLRYENCVRTCEFCSRLLVVNG